MTLATHQDVADRLGRGLNAGEIPQVDAYLVDAEATILRFLPDILTDAALDLALKQRVVSVECAVTLRAARLTDTISGPYPAAEVLGAAPASRANVTVLASEWRKLGLKDIDAFSLNGAALPPGPGSYPDRNPGWGPWWMYGGY